MCTAFGDMLLVHAAFASVPFTCDKTEGAEKEEGRGGIFIVILLTIT